MNYGRKTLISDWHKNREAEPQDWDSSGTGTCDGRRTLQTSTYKRLGTQSDGDWRTTTQMSQSEKQHEAKNPRKSMVQADCFHSLVFDRKTGASDPAGTSVLSCYQPRCTENELITTYALDYAPPHITTEQAIQAKKVMDRKLDFRRSQSQFTDVADYRRWGRNTWQDFNDDQVAKSLYRQINRPCP